MNDYYRTCKFAKECTKKHKKEQVSNDTYIKVFNACKGKCVLCGTPYNLQAHHIRYRSERRDLINEPTNMVLLCVKHHLKVHSNKHYWQPILLELIKEIYKWKKVLFYIYLNMKQ